MPDPLTDKRFGPADSSRAARVLGTLFTAVWLLYLIQPVAGLFEHHHSALYIGGGLGIVVVFCAVYLIYVPSWPHPPERALAGLGVMAALAVAGCVIYGGSGASTLWIFVSSAAGLLVPDRRWAVRAVIGCGVCYVIFSLTAHVDRTDFLLNLLPTVVVGLAMIGLRRQISLMNELRQAREEVAGLAANEERLRLARDMHDLTGQSLSMITLKSELAARLLTRLPPGQGRSEGHRPGPRGRRAERGRQPAHPPRAGRAGGQPGRRRARRDRRRALPVGRHGPQLPVRLHPEERRPQPHRGAAPGGGTRLAVSWHWAVSQSP